MSALPTTTPLAADGLPWYRYRWPWVLLAIPMSAVAFGIVMISTALIYPDDLVVDNYYKEGMAINRTLAMDVKAVAIGVTAVIEVGPNEMVTLALSGATDAAVTASLFHVTDSAQDEFIVLYPEMSGSEKPSAIQVYTGQSLSMVKSLSSPGIWYIELRGSDEPWRVRQRVQTPLRTLEVLPR
jgi:hypothetical protein